MDDEASWRNIVWWAKVVGIYALAAIIYIVLRPLVRWLFRGNEWFGWVVLAYLAAAGLQYLVHEALTARN